jgi:GxxExxY protein
MTATRQGTEAFREEIYAHKDLTAKIIAAFYEVYNQLGYGLLESVYLRALAIELAHVGLHVEREIPLRVWYKGVPVGAFRADYLVESEVIVEVKAARQLVDADKAQLLNYLRCSGKQVGLLLHFGPRPHIKRMVASGPFRAGSQVTGVAAASSASSAPSAPRD